MRIVTGVSLVGALSLFPVAVSAQAIAINSEKGQVMPLETAKLSAAENAVLAADASWAKAYQTCDMKLMENLLRDDVVFIHAHARVDTKPIIMKEFRQCTNEETIIEPIRVVVTSPDSALVEARMKNRYKGQQNWIVFLYTRVYVRSGGNWQMVAHQTTFQTAEAMPGGAGVAPR
jgi:ketosteroid isomerase-like protein